MGRLRAAWQVLMGQRLTPLQIEAEWIEYKMIFQDLMERQSAMLARQAKMEKRRLDRIQENVAASNPPISGKAQLRSRAAAMRGLGRFQAQVEIPRPKAPEAD